MEFDPVGGPGGPAPAKRSRRRLALWLALGAAVAVTAVLLSWRVCCSMPRAPGGTLAVKRMVPEGTRIKIEVLNATDVRGLARQATFFLRDAGFDVVYFGNTAERADSTVVLDRSNHPEWALLAARAMGRSRIEPKPDSSHFLDLTVLVGRHWAPPRQTLYP